MGLYPFCVGGGWRGGTAGFRRNYVKLNSGGFFCRQNQVKTFLSETEFQTEFCCATAGFEQNLVWLSLELSGTVMLEQDFVTVCYSWVQNCQASDSDSFVWIWIGSERICKGYRRF